MSRVVIGHKDGKPIYRYEGPNAAQRTGHDPVLIRPGLTPHRPGNATGLPGQGVARVKEIRNG